MFHAALSKVNPLFAIFKTGKETLWKDTKNDRAENQRT